MTTTPNPKNPFDSFMDSLVEELIAMSDADVLGNLNPDEVRETGLKLLDIARRRAGRQRLRNAKLGVAANQNNPVKPNLMTLDVSDARRYLMSLANDSRYTLAARDLNNLSDEEIVALYGQVKLLEAGNTGKME